MKFFETSSCALALMGFTLLCLGAANAGSISTPIVLLEDSNELICIANNVSGSPITVTVKIVGSVTTKTGSCTLPAGDRLGCKVAKDGESGHCVISVNSLTDEQVAARLRGILFSRKNASPFTVESVVQAH